jgi:hypothetical protein
MRSSVGGVRLLSHELGVPLPREVARLIAQIPMIGTAMTALLPIMGAVFAVTMIAKFIEKHEEAQEKIRNMAVAVDELAMKEEDQARSVELSNLKLEDQLAKLEGRPNTNRLKESLIETAKEANNLAKEFNADFKSVDKAVLSAQGPMSVFMQSLRDAGAILDAKTWSDMASKWSKGSDAVKELGSQLAGVSNQATHILDLQMKPKSDSVEGQIADAQELADAYKQQGKNLIMAEKAAKNMAHPDQELIGQLKQGEVAAVAAEQSKQDQIKTIRLHAAIDAASDAADADSRAEAAGNDWFEKQKAQAESKLRWAKDAQRTQDDVTNAIEKSAAATEEAAETEAAATAAVNGILKKAEEERVKGQQAVYKEELKNTIDAARERLAAEEEGDRHSVAMGKMTDTQELDAKKKHLQEALKLEIDGLNLEISELDTSDTMYLAKMKAFEDKKVQLAQTEADKEVAIENKKAEEIKKAEEKTANAIAETVSKSIIEGKSMGQAFAQLGKKMLETAMENLIEMILLQDLKKEKDAGSAAASAYTHVMNEPLPPWLAFPLAIAAGAEAFAGVMAFDQGGLVPGYGNYDSVPAMLTPGESVVTKALTQQVENSQGGSSNQGHTVHIHMGDVHAVDAKGFEGLLEKHAAVVGKHVQSQMRRMHRKVN